tara:strand:- start:1291 stop:1563 length:273 start_codon:yes stop_codon:yes gene_type:complete
MASAKNRRWVVGDNKGLAAWAEKLEQELAVDTVPEGWATIRQLSDKLKLSSDALAKRINRMVLSGDAEKKLFNIQTRSGVRKAAHYKIKP